MKRCHRLSIIQSETGVDWNSGYSYEMFFDTDKFEGDVIEEYGEVNIVVDAESLEHIKGATLDYKEGLMETGFSIDNPNVSRTCGCGNSFS